MRPGQMWFLVKGVGLGDHTLFPLKSRGIGDIL